MPYAFVSEIPDYVPKANKHRWKDIWNAAYEQQVKQGEAKPAAEQYAFAVANSKAGPHAEKVVEPTIEEQLEMLKLEEGLTGYKF